MTGAAPPKPAFSTSLTDVTFHSAVIPAQSMCIAGGFSPAECANYFSACGYDPDW